MWRNAYITAVIERTGRYENNQQLQNWILHWYKVYPQMWNILHWRNYIPRCEIYCIVLKFMPYSGQYILRAMWPWKLKLSYSTYWNAKRVNILLCFCSTYKHCWRSLLALKIDFSIREAFNLIIETKWILV